MCFKKLKRETKICIDDICDKYGVNPNEVKLYGNSIGDFTKEDIDNMGDEEMFKIKKLLVKKLSKFYMR